MLVTNQTANDYWFGPLHLPGGVGQQITVDDTSATSLYLTNDSVADAINNLYASGKITVSSEAQPFPRPTGVPTLLHGDGSPEGLVYAPQGSVYMRRDGTLTNGGVLYLKTTGITVNTGWLDLSTASGASAVLPSGTILSFGGAAAPSGWLLCDGSAISRAAYSTLFGVIGTAYGAGDGSTTFNVPDLRGRVPVGKGTHTDVSTLGNNDGVALANRSPKHNSTNGVTLTGSVSKTGGASLTGSIANGTLALSDPHHHHGLNGSGSTPGVLIKTSADGYDFGSSYTGHNSNTLLTNSDDAATGMSLSGAVSNGTLAVSDTIGISNTLGIGGSIGPGGTRPIDTPAFLVTNYMIKT